LNYDWKSYLDFLVKIDNKTYKNQRSVISKTHPPIADRIRKIEAEAGKLVTESFNGRKHQKRFYEKTH
jgi:CDP-glycerol glycerophosphotransferase (TagB/SpsB family)